MIGKSVALLRRAAKPGGPLPIVRWLVAGLVFMGLNTFFLKTFVGWFALKPFVGTICAGELSTLLRYVINDRWVFGRSRLEWRRLWQYHVANSGAFAIWWVATNLLIYLGTNYLLAGVLAVAFSTGFSMASNFYWVWRKKHSSAPAPH